MKILTLIFNLLFYVTDPDVLLNAYKDIGLAVNTKKSKCLEIGRDSGMIAI